MLCTHFSERTSSFDCSNMYERCLEGSCMQFIHFHYLLLTYTRILICCLFFKKKVADDDDGGSA